VETTARFYLERMRIEIDRARRRQFPDATDVPAKWLAYVDGRLKSIEMLLERPTSSADADISAENLLTNITACYQSLDYLARADSSQVADYVVMSLMRWFRRANDACDYLFTADKEFESVPLFVKDEGEAEVLHSDHQRAIDGFGPIVYRITMPGGALGAGFHIPLVAHELGHVLIETHSDDIDGAMEVLSKGLGDEMSDSYRRWLHEIVADTICGFVAGPAALFALHEKLRGDSRPDGNYPHTALRTKSLSDFVLAKFGSQFRARGVRASDWNDWKVRSRNELAREARGHGNWAALSKKIIDDAPEARKIAVRLARRHIGELEYRPQQFTADLRMHLESFLHVIPPFETSGNLRRRKPTELSSILNVGWFIAAFRLDKLRIKVPEGADRKGKILVELDRLMLKSIELSEIRRTWEDDGERTGQKKAAGAPDGEKGRAKARRRATA
jgi:hypothetical protein